MSFSSITPTLCIDQRTILSNIPSASGIEAHNGVIYIVGDNSPWLFILNKRFEITNKIRITEQPTRRDNTIKKKRKPDFEATTLVDWHGEKTLFVFASGSKSPQRDCLVTVNCAEPSQIRTFGLTDFYRHLMNAGKLNEDQLNIEAAVVYEEILWLFNRGKNIIFQIGLAEFIAYLESQAELPSVQIQTVQLPSLNSIEAGFSGAGLARLADKIIVTASVENTSNWIDDGAVLGSFVGVIDAKSISEQPQMTWLTIAEADNTLPIKVESVAVLSETEKCINLLLVTDSDGGDSELLVAKLCI